MRFVSHYLTASITSTTTGTIVKVGKHRIDNKWLQNLCQTQIDLQIFATIIWISQMKKDEKSKFLMIATNQE